MNTANIKKYAPLARNSFITAVTKRANELGIYASHSESATQEGQVLKIEGRSVDLKLKGARNKLIKRVESIGFNQLMEHIAYTWFNRLCAVRYMELHDYLDHGLRVLSHPENNTGFEILEHAPEVAEDLGLNRDQIIELKLAGDQDELLYRTLLLGQCHALHKAMPFLFEAIDDETELLLPNNLTRTDSILRGLVDDIPADDWQDVEIIGWLYQFYISEKKDQVIGKVVKSEDIPAATQLFTPNWIVKYMVQNSLGRQWLQAHPESTLKNEMAYYVEGESDARLVGSNSSLNPEDIKLIDPASGSGHILVEAYDLLKAIYQERGYRSRDIPQLILENNLYGLDIDTRAAQLSGFALMMKARADDRRIFSRDVQLNVMALQSSAGLESLKDELLGSDEQYDWQGLQLIIGDLIDLFSDVQTLGSLIRVPESIADYLPTAERVLTELSQSQDIFNQHKALSLLPLVKQAQILAQLYDVVVANPPYMGGKYQTPVIRSYLKQNFKGYEKDLFSAFIVRNLELSKPQGQLGFVTPFTWMFIKSYEHLRKLILTRHTLESLIQPEYHAFFDSAYVPLCTFTLANNHIKEYTGSFIKLSDFYGADTQAPKTLEAIQNKECGWFYRAKPDDFKKISGSPIAYWVSDSIRNIFYSTPSIKNIINPKQGASTGDDETFVRYWFEIDYQRFGLGMKSLNEALESNMRYFPFDKGGEFRRWYGNNEKVLKLDLGSYTKLKEIGNNLPSRDLYFNKGITWSKITSFKISVRFDNYGFVFSSVGLKGFPSVENLYCSLGFMNSSVVEEYTKILSPTLSIVSGDIERLPYINIENKQLNKNVSRLIFIAMVDWNTYETSWDFQSNPLIVGSAERIDSQQIVAENVGLRDKIANPTYRVSDIYTGWQNQNQNTIAEMQRLEQENNRLFIDAYGLQDELNPDVPLEQITLTVNPKYRYGGKLSDEALANRFQSDTLAELISYAIGCMMGRYRMDAEGLIYAHTGNVDFDSIYDGEIDSRLRGNDVVFKPDNDGILPLTDQEWFADDVTQRINDFVRVVWGTEHQQQNLDFIAQSLCLYALKPKSGETSLDTIRRYLSTQFYKDHLKTYKKRPIYWLFSSGKQKAFECLVYLHRYNDSTLARMRTEYVTPLLGKYSSEAEGLTKQIDDASSTVEASRYKKALTALEKKQTELSEFDDKLKHHADMRISLDLDDGVKVNYGKFGDLLADVKGVTGVK